MGLVELIIYSNGSQPLGIGGPAGWGEGEPGCTSSTHTIVAQVVGQYSLTFMSGVPACMCASARQPVAHASCAHALQPAICVAQF